MKSIFNHREVVKFACCLSDQPDVLIEIICDRFASQGSETYVDRDYLFLRELTAELSTSAFTVHPLHNQFVNYFYFGGDKDLKEEERPVFLPSKMFKGMGTQCYVQILAMGIRDEKNRTGNQSDENIPKRMSRHNEGMGEHVEVRLSCSPGLRSCKEMEIAVKMLSKIKERASVCVTEIDLCCLHMTENPVSNDERHFTCNIDLSDFKELVSTTKLMKEISSYQKLDVHQFHLKNMNFNQDCQMQKVVAEIMGMSSFKHCRSMMIIGGIAPLMWHELYEQLPHFSELEKLILQNKVGDGGFTKGSVQNLIPNLCHCRKIATLNLSNINLSDCIQKFLTWELDNLKRLILERTQLIKNDLVNLFQAISNNKFPDLIELNVSENNLEGCIHHLVNGSGLGLQSLEVLNLKDTELRDSDTSALGTLCKSGRLPKLTTFILTGNELTGAINDILSDGSHPGFSNLETLMIKEAQLNGNDVKSLSNVVKEGRLPKLKSLCLGLHSDQIYDMDVEEFIKTSVKHAQHKMDIRIEGQLSDNSCELMTSVSAESNVHLKVKMRKGGKMEDDSDNDRYNVDSSKDDFGDNVDNREDDDDNFDSNEYDCYNVDSSEDDCSDNVDNREDDDNSFDSNEYDGYNVDSSEDDCSDNVDNREDDDNSFDSNEYDCYNVDSSEDDCSDNVDNREDDDNNFDSNEYDGYNVDSSEDNSDYFSDY